MDDWIEVPHERISDTTLQSLLEEACTRDGTEMTDATLKVEQLRDGLRCGHIKLRYYPAHDCCHLVWSQRPTVTPGRA